MGGWGVERLFVEQVFGWGVRVGLGVAFGVVTWYSVDIRLFE